MKNILRHSFILLFSIIFLVSCEESRKRATDKLNELNERTEELNTAIDNGLEKIESIDSVVRKGTEQLREVDSLVTKSTSKLDSIAKEKAKAWEELTTF